VSSLHYNKHMEHRAAADSGEDNTTARKIAPGMTALVFAGGGSLGAIQVGMLKALSGQSLKIDCVVGTSVGAINAAYFAGDPSPAGVQRLENIWRGLRREDVFPIGALRSLVGLLRGKENLVLPDALKALIKRHLPYQQLEQAHIPCHIMTTDLLAGTEVRLSSGSVVDALLASAAIPGVFPPVKLHGRLLVDGGVANHTPISIAVELGATRLIVLPAGYPCTISAPPHSAIAAALHALNLMTVHRLVAEVQHFGQQVEIIIAPPLCPLSVSAYDFSQSAQLIERAASMTRQWLEGGGLTRPGIPHELPAHRHRPA
jgi:NTE family protein